MRDFTARCTAPPPPLAQGEVVVCATAGPGGDIGVLVTTEPAQARGFVAAADGSRRYYYEPPRSCPVALLRHSAGAWRRVKLEHLPVSYPKIALLPGGELLVAGVRAVAVNHGRERRNAHVFGPDGAYLRTFELGDDIEDLSVDDAGTIWTTHGEEGWSQTGSVVRWTVDGARLWDSGIACSDIALNARGGTAWAFRFPRTIVHVRHGSSAEYASPVHRVHVIAVDGDHLLLAGSVEPDGDGGDLSWCRVQDGEIRRLDAARVVDEEGRPFEWSVLASHGSRVYFHDYGQGYHAIDVSDR
jgi:hypothetical protein